MRSVISCAPLQHACSAHTDAKLDSCLLHVAEAAPAAEGEAEAEAAPEVPPADEEAEEGEAGPPKPDYSRKNLEYVVTSAGQVTSSFVLCLQALY